MIYFETEEDENDDDVSKVLFTHLYAGNDEYDGEFGGGDDDEDEEVTSLESSAEILTCLDDTPSAAKDVKQDHETTEAARRSSMKPSLFLSQLLDVCTVKAENRHLSLSTSHS